MDAIRELCQPNLDAPVAIIGFKGWGNAGEISSGAVSFLRQALDTKPLAELDTDPFMDFTAERPKAVIRNGRLERISRTRDTFHYDRNGGGRDAILFIGREPNLRWNAYIDQLTDFFFSHRVSLVIILGGTYDEILHTGPPKVSVMAEEMVIRQAALDAGAFPTDYDGQVAIHTLLYAACRERGLPVVALWGRAPVYVQNGNFGQVQLMTEVIAALGGPNPNPASLQEAQDEMSSQIQDMIDQSPKLAAYVDRLTQRLTAKTENRAAQAESRPLPADTCKVIPLSRTRKPGH